MSQSIPTGYIPRATPGDWLKKTCPGGWNLTFESCPGAGNSTRAGILWKIKLKLKKNSVDQIFTKKNKTSGVLDLFRGLHCTCLFNGIFPGLWVNFLVLLSHIPYEKYEELPLACLFEIFTGL